MPDSPPSSTVGVTLTPTYRRNTSIAFLLIVLVVVAFGLSFWLGGIALNWLALGIGAVGWILALLLRGPLLLLAQGILHDPMRVKTVAVLASGPCEEVVRLLAILIIGHTFSLAISLGLGWAAIEAWYTIVNGVVMLSLMGRQDEKAQQAQAMLAAMGQDTVTRSVPFWGVLERASASALHIGWTLLLAWQPPLVIATLLMHSGTNLMAVSLARKSLLITELCLALLGALVLIAGLAVFGRL